MAGILSISSDKGLLKTRHMLLEKEGFEVFSVLNIGDAIDIARRQRLDLIIIGHCLPPDMKKELVKQVKAKSSAPWLALLRPHESPVSNCEYHLEAGDPAAFVKMVQQICNGNRRSIPPEKKP